MNTRPPLVSVPSKLVKSYMDIKDSRGPDPEPLMKIMARVNGNLDAHGAHMKKEDWFTLNSALYQAIRLIETNDERYREAFSRLMRGDPAPKAPIKRSRPRIVP